MGRWAIDVTDQQHRSLKALEVSVRSFDTIVKDE